MKLKHQLRSYLQKQNKQFPKPYTRTRKNSKAFSQIQIFDKNGLLDSYELSEKGVESYITDALSVVEVNKMLNHFQ
jgi:hypothetical protein